MAAVEAGKTVALANKEALVTAGDLMTEAAAKNGATLLPVDSEHNAIFQSLAGSRIDQVSRIILTASGGPFRTASAGADARCDARAGRCASELEHGREDLGRFGDADEQGPRADRGALSVRAAVRAASTFSSTRSRSSIRWSNTWTGRCWRSWARPTCGFPIAYALAWPDRMPTPAQRLDLAAIARLDFEEPDLERFPGAATGPRSTGGGRIGAGRPQRRQRSRGRDLPRRRHSVSGHQRGWLKCALQENDRPAPQSIEDVFEIDREVRRSVTQCHRGTLRLMLSQPPVWLILHRVRLRARPARVHP